MANAVGKVVAKVSWLRGKVFNPKVMLRDVTVPNRVIPPPGNWARDVMADFEHKRVKGDLSVPYMAALVEKAFLKLAGDRRGPLALVTGRWAR